MCLFRISQTVSTQVEVTFGDAGRKQRTKRSYLLQSSLQGRIFRGRRVPEMLLTLLLLWCRPAVKHSSRFPIITWRLKYGSNANRQTSKPSCYLQNSTKMLYHEHHENADGAYNDDYKSQNVTGTLLCYFVFHAGLYEVFIQRSCQRVETAGHRAVKLRKQTILTKKLIKRKVTSKILPQSVPVFPLLAAYSSNYISL